jgi:hypothetical protein
MNLPSTSAPRILFQGNLGTIPDCPQVKQSQGVEPRGKRRELEGVRGPGWILAGLRKLLDNRDIAEK